MSLNVYSNNNRKNLIMNRVAKIEGAKALNKSQQKVIFGGNPHKRCTPPKIDCYNPITHRWSCKFEADCDW